MLKGLFHKAASNLLLGLLVSTLVFSFPLSVLSQFEQWVPHIPNASQVELEYWKENGVSFMDAAIEFPSSGVNITSWGTPIIVGNNISVDAEIWRWTGVDLPVVITKTYTYNLGNLTKGKYIFIFKVWGFPVKNVTLYVSMADLTGGAPNPWDFVPDGIVDGSDLIVVSRCFGSYPGASSPLIWYSNCDITDDDLIDGSDLIIVARHYGEEDS